MLKITTDITKITSKTGRGQSSTFGVFLSHLTVTERAPMTLMNFSHKNCPPSLANIKGDNESNNLWAQCPLDMAISQYHSILKGDPLEVQHTVSVIFNFGQS